MWTFDEHQVPPEPDPGDDPVPDQKPTPDDDPVPDHNPISRSLPRAGGAVSDRQPAA